MILNMYPWTTYAIWIIKKNFKNEFIFKSL